MSARCRGFTIIEMAIALAVTGMLFGIGFAMVEMGSAARRRTLREADAAATRRNATAALRAALSGAAGSMVSAPNLGVARVGVAGGAGGEADTLILARATGPGLRVASRPCRDGSAACLALLGDQRASVRPAALLLVGSATVGYRIVQIRAGADVFTASCGADCAGEIACPPVVGEPANVPVVTGATTTDGTLSATCEESFHADGRRCVERRGTRVLAATVTQRCSARRPNATFTEVRFDDRTEVPLGFPGLESWTPISGGGAPAVAAIPAQVVRIRMVPEAGERALVRDPGLDVDGAWRAPVRIAGPVATFRVESLHQGTPSWARGDGVPAVLDAAGNRIVRTVPAGAGGTGSEYLRGYHTRVGLRLRIEVVGRGPGGERIVAPLDVVRAVGPAARGGAREDS